jgi:hypothetical protein
MYKSFQIVRDFVNDLWGYDFLQGTTNQKAGRKLGGIRELEKACHTMVRIVDERRKPSIKELTEHIYPLLEISMQWAQLKKEGKLTEKFLKGCKQRLKNLEPGNFYGVIFELDMASRCLLSNWDIKFVEDYTEKEQQIEFVFFKKGDSETFGVECTSKRYTEDLTVEKLNEVIEEKAKKFEPSYIERLGISQGGKLLIIDVTREDFSIPMVIGDLERIEKSSKLDVVVLTWREDITDGVNHSLKVKYRAIGNIEHEYFSTTRATEIRVSDNKLVLFVRKYVEPEPTWGKWGPEETAP